MFCREWNPEWVAHLYGEAEGREAESATAHLAQCAGCREALAELDAMRRLLHDEAATLAPPVAPRVLVLPAGRLRHPAWAFASGLAAALLVFASGLYVGIRASRPASESIPPRSDAASAIGADPQAASSADLENRLAALESAVAALPRANSGSSGLTAEELAAGLAALERRVDVGRARDVEFLLGEISATERRAGKWVDETRQAVRYVAARNDPRLIEH